MADQQSAEERRPLRTLSGPNQSLKLSSAQRVPVREKKAAPTAHFMLPTESSKMGTPLRKKPMDSPCRPSPPLRADHSQLVTPPRPSKERARVRATDGKARPVPKGANAGALRTHSSGTPPRRRHSLSPGAAGQLRREKTRPADRAQADRAPARRTPTARKEAPRDRGEGRAMARQGSAASELSAIPSERSLHEVSLHSFADTCCSAISDANGTTLLSYDLAALWADLQGAGVGADSLAAARSSPSDELDTAFIANETDSLLADLTASVDSLRSALPLGLDPDPRASLNLSFEERLADPVARTLATGLRDPLPEARFLFRPIAPDHP